MRSIQIRVSPNFYSVLDQYKKNVEFRNKKPMSTPEITDMMADMFKPARKREGLWEL